MRRRDALGAGDTDEVFTPFFPRRGQPAEAPGRLAWVTVMPLAAGLSDRPAAAAVRRRMDWQYAVALELTDPGFDAAVLREFRGRGLGGQAAQVLFETRLPRCLEAGPLKPRGWQRTDSTHGLAAIQMRNRLECVGETLRHALHTLAVVVPDWVERYGRRFEDDRLPPGRPACYVLAATIGAGWVQPPADD